MSLIKGESPVLRAWDWCRTKVGSLTGKLAPLKQFLGSNGSPDLAAKTRSRTDSRDSYGQPWGLVEDEVYASKDVQETLITEEEITSMKGMQPLHLPPTNISPKEFSNCSILVSQGRLTQTFKFVLGEIFHRFDIGRDDKLSLIEIALFHSAVFEEQLTRQSFRWYQETSNMNDSNEIALDGFFNMWQAMIDDSPHRVWKMLSCLGYNQQLRLQEPLVRLINGRGDLSKQFLDVITEIFRAFDLDDDGVLSSVELSIFTRVLDSEEAFTGPFMRWMIEQRFVLSTNDGLSMWFAGMSSMFYALTVRRPADMLKRLKRLGFNASLEQISHSPRVIAEAAAGYATADLDESAMSADSVEESVTAASAMQQLLLRGTELTPRFRDIVDAIFDRFDISCDEVLDRRELTAWHQIYSRRPMDEEALRWLQSHFTCDTAGWMTRTGFRDLHAYLAQHVPEDVLLELTAFGYNTMLEQKPLFEDTSSGGHILAVAVRPHQACGEGELPLCIADIVVVTNIARHGWLLGECPGRYGSFPAHSVIFIDELNESILSGRLCVAHTAYRACDDEELSFPVGAEIEFVRVHSESGWWEGRLDDVSGLFPAECCTLSTTFATQRPSQRRRTQSASSGRPPASTSATAGRLIRPPSFTTPYSVLHSAPAQHSMGSTQSQSRSSPVPPLSPRSQQRRRLSSNSTAPGSPVLEPRSARLHCVLAVEQEADTSLPLRRPHRSSRTSYSSAGKEDLSGNDTSSHSSGSRKSAAPMAESSQHWLKAVVVVDYEPRTDQHLALRKGADVFVLSSGTDIVGECFGECGGQRGLFPAENVLVRTDKVPDELQKQLESRRQLQMQQRVEVTQQRLVRQLSDVTSELACLQEALRQLNTSQHS
eukprot:TRINITY_DN2844_c0_g1_i2.p1 TRINITY_DN2844_c0_g1~~TRINITY_DN2844_c0_g1_i2.p1  ORF type:complete len:879 (-),score=154.11 TRINITY_DN2844_c0_g1_i2:167-2803(-)